MDSLNLDPSETINDLVQRHPSTLAVLAAYGIDTCCGGEQTLAAAALEAGADFTTLLDDVRAAVTKAEARQ